MSNWVQCGHQFHDFDSFRKISVREDGNNLYYAIGEYNDGSEEPIIRGYQSEEDLCNWILAQLQPGWKVGVSRL